MPEIRNESFLLKAIYDRLTGVGIADADSGLGAEVGADGLHVDVQAQSAAIQQTPTVTAGVYVANDAVGGLLTFVNASRGAGKGGVIKNVVILDDAGQDAELELWLFDSIFTAEGDTDAWSPSEADLRKLVAIISTEDGAWFDAGTPSAARIEVSQSYNLVGTSLFGQLVTRGTPTFAATDDVTVILQLMLD